MAVGYESLVEEDFDGELGEEKYALIESSKVALSD
jgi:hypothetical protein